MGRILYFQWHSFMNAGMERALQKLEIDYDTFFYTFTDWEKDEEFCYQFEEKLASETYEYARIIRCPISHGFMTARSISKIWIHYAIRVIQSIFLTAFRQKPIRNRE